MARWIWKVVTKLQEVDSYQWLAIPKLLARVESNPGDFTPEALEVLTHTLFADLNAE